jgi:hypothetical protein
VESHSGGRTPVSLHIRRTMGVSSHVRRTVAAVRHIDRDSVATELRPRGLCLSCLCDSFLCRWRTKPQGRPRYFWAHSETQVRPCCPHLDPLESFARLALARVRLVCSAWSRAGHPRREASGSGRAGAIRTFSGLSSFVERHQTPGPAPVLKDTVFLPAYALERPHV